MKQEKIFTTKRLLAVVISMLCALAVFFAVYPRGGGSSAEQLDANVAECAAEGEEATPYGVFTQLSLSINGGDGRIWATVKNAFTLFPATVQVIVELYSSDIYYDSFTNMELVSSAIVADLNIGKTLTTDGYTNGVQKYWKARMQYKIDKGGWESKVTRTLLYDANGNVLS